MLRRNDPWISKGEIPASGSPEPPAGEMALGDNSASNSCQTFSDGKKTHPLGSGDVLSYLHLILRPSPAPSFTNRQEEISPPSRIVPLPCRLLG
jgi:hypothetical protein